MAARDKEKLQPREPNSKYEGMVALLSDYDKSRMRWLQQDAELYVRDGNIGMGEAFEKLLSDEKLRKSLAKLADDMERSKFDRQDEPKMVAEKLRGATIAIGLNVSDDDILERLGYLVTAASCIIEGFAFGNVIRQEDWLPDELFPGPKWEGIWKETRVLYTVKRDKKGRVKEVREWTTDDFY